ncbi:ABC transporter G family member 25-like isoform X2 [Phragmites australis]|uniref:ABC transporter G family member 25-like isoform X2 n=1 Tax=Phragmites australis TaxID=29695 RepID=UPI002D78928B|nr:ABC transporter G family member 25-like isoform X2 [Phragmites australis]
MLPFLSISNFILIQGILTFLVRSCNVFTRGRRQMVAMLCRKPEVELYVKTLISSRSTPRISRNCNQNSWALGCQPGWACATLDDESSDQLIPSRAVNCRPCCPGFFCPRGLTCMMPCPLGAYCPLGSVNETTGLCDPYFYQITPGLNHTCGTADSWADVVTTNDVFCPPGHYCPTTTQKYNCSKGYYCRKGSTDENKCRWKNMCQGDNSIKEDIGLYGGALIVVLCFILLLVYNCSGLFIAIQVKMSSRSRKKAAKIAHKSAAARERWKLAKELALRHEVAMPESFSSPEQSATSSNGALHAAEANANGSKNRKNNQTDNDRVMQLDIDKLTFSGVVSLATENRPRRRRPMIEVVFRGLTLSIGKKKLLQCVTGKLSPGRVTAIMGPSGAGKTTFLNAVLGKTSGYKKDGIVLINGKPGSMQSYKKITGFVPQDDIVHGNLTVEENLWFSACCRLSKGMSRSDKVRVLEWVIGSLRLQEIRNSLVGTVEMRGISGGQRKRVNVGIEMVMEPSLLILDEPTTGLDSASSQLLLRALRQEALQGVNVCAVVHQPSYTLFNMFDDFVLLARGGLIVYHGPVSEAEMYFAGLEVKVPDRENPPDYFIDILEGIVKTKMRENVTPKHLPLLWMLHNGYEVPDDLQDLENINTIRELYAVRSISSEESLAEQSVNTDYVHQNVRQSNKLLDRKTPGVFAQYGYYLGRVAKQRLREASQQAVDYLILCIAGICIGTIAKVRDDSFGVTSYGYAIMAVSLLCQLAALRSFSPEKLQYRRERESGMSSLAYFLARDTLDHFNTAIKPIIFLSTFYFFNNPRSTFKDNCLVLLALIYCVTGIGYTFAIWFELGLAQLCSALIPVVLVLVGTKPELPRVVKELCYPKWALEAFIIAGAKEYSGVWLITRCGALLKGGYDINNFGHCITIIMLYGVLFRFVALFSLRKLK